MIRNAGYMNPSAYEHSAIRPRRCKMDFWWGVGFLDVYATMCTTFPAILSASK
jgi:hypothetical protein